MDPAIAISPLVLVIQLADKRLHRGIVIRFLLLLMPVVVDAARDAGYLDQNIDRIDRP